MYVCSPTWKKVCAEHMYMYIYVCLPVIPLNAADVMIRGVCGTLPTASHEYETIQILKF